MNKNSRRLGVYTIIISAITIAAVVLRTIALYNNFDYGTGYFNNSLMITVASIVMALGFLLTLILSLTLDKVSLRATFDSPHTYVPLGVLGVSTLALFFYLFREANVFSIIGGEADIEKLLSLASAVFAIIAIIHLFMTTFYTASQVKTRAYFATGAIIFYALFATTIYFDSSSAMNAHVKVTDQMAVLFAAVFMLFEARISLGREKWRGYMGSGLIALAITSYAAIPNLIIYFTRATTLSASIEVTVFLLAFSLFAISRLVLTMRLGEAGEAKSITTMREYAEAREAEIRNGETKQDEDDMQITIDDLFGEEIEGEGENDETADETGDTEESKENEEE